MDFPVNITALTTDCEFVDDAGMGKWLNRLRSLQDIEVYTIGSSRAGRALYGFRVGSGEKIATITAGAHADEPAGPMTAMLLLDMLGQDDAIARRRRREYTWLVCPQVNPDGAEANRGWFAPEADFGTYLRNVVRELPGDDVEFGYPGGGQTALRPENQAVADFFSQAQPAHVHASLHSMAFASGAWFLLGGSAIDDVELRRELAMAAQAADFGLHDVERKGEKGFRRIARGFCTTPDSRAMARFFTDKGDHAMAERFRFSSMEWTTARNPAARLLVTELPTFALQGGFGQQPAKVPDDPVPHLPDNDTPPVPGETPYERFRDEVKALVAKGDIAAAVALGDSYGLTPVPFAAQCRLMLDSIRIVAGL